MRKAITTLILLAASTAAPAQMHKCITADGQVRYSDRACPAADRASAIKAAPIAAPTIADAEMAQARRRAANGQVREIDRQQARASADARAKAVTVAADRVREVKRQNRDPARCAHARYALAAMQRRDPIGWRMDVSSFEYQQQEALYCGP